MSTDQQNCQKCGAVIEFTHDEWVQLVSSILDRSRRKVLCPTCETAYRKHSAYQKRYYAAHRAEKKAYHAKHSAEIKAYKRAYRAEHRKEIRAYDQHYYWQHRDELIARSSFYQLKRKLVAQLGYFPEGNKPDSRIRILSSD